MSKLMITTAFIHLFSALAHSVCVIEDYKRDTSGTVKGMNDFRIQTA